MKEAKNEIIETVRANNLKYYITIAEKENESGIMFNDRLFFLLSTQHIGYISSFNLNDKPESIDFQKAKTTIVLTSIKSVGYKQKELTVRYNLIESNKNTERKWIIRFTSQNLAKLWYTLIKKQRVQSTQPKLVPQPPKQPIKQKLQPINEQKNKKSFELVSKNLELNQKLKKQKEMKQMATSISPKNSRVQSKSKKQNSQESLAKILNHGYSQTDNYENSELGNESYRKTDKFTNLDETKKSQKKSIYSQTPHKRAKNLIKKYVDVNQDHKNESFRQRKLDSSLKKSREVKKNQDEDLPKINILPHLSNKKYYEETRNNNEYQTNFQKKTEDIVKKSNVSETQFERLNVSSELKKYNVQKSKTASPSNSQKVHRFEFSVLKQKDSNLPWTFRYIKYNHLIFDQFKIHCQKLLKSIIQDLSKPSEQQKYKSKLIKSNMITYEINDIQVKLSLMGLQDASHDQINDQMDGMRVCEKEALRALKKQFNNYKALYEYLGNSNQLKVPLICLCEYQGFFALFKIISNNVNRLIKTNQFKEQLDRLNTISKIEINFNDTINNVVILLDESYYNNFKKQGDQDLDFRVYFVQEINNYLFPDLITDQLNNKNLILRKEIIETFQTDSLAQSKHYQHHFYNEIRSERISKDELLELSRQLLRAISQCIFQLQSLRIFFMNSKELSQYFHQKGVNIRYIGHIYSHLKVQFQKRILMTQMAARSCKSLLKKTLQDLALQSKLQGQNDLRTKLIDFFNCIFGYTSQTAQMWKVLSSHSQVYYGVSLNLHEIDRWFFIISLVQNCRLEVEWEKVNTELAFKTNQFFSEQNLKGIKYNSKTYDPYFSQQYQQVTSIIYQVQSYEGYQKLNKILNLTYEELPAHLKPIEHSIKKYLAHFIPPEQSHQSYNHLRIYQSLEGFPSKTFFEILLIQIKWNLKLKQKDAYIKNCDFFIREVTKFYGEFHPIFTNLYDLFSAYHLNNCEYEDAITFAKSSLVNQMKICGTNHQKTSQCYYHLALCYIKANKREEAISHIKKSQQYFQTNKKKQTIVYAIMCLKLSLLYLNQNMIDSSIEASQNCCYILKMFQSQNNHFQDEETQCLQVLTRCYQIEKDLPRMRQLAIKCREKIKHVENVKNFEKLLKIYLFSYFSQLQSSKSSMYIDIIAELSLLITQNQQQKAYQYLRQRIDENSFFNSLQTYLENINSIDNFMRQNQIVKNWNFFQKQYPRETVKDFVALSTQLLVFLGQAFIVGALRQAL